MRLLKTDLHVRLTGIGIALLLLLVALSCTSPEASVASPSAVRLAVDRDGLYVVTADTLAQVGFVPDIDALALSVDGQPVPFERIEIGNNWAIRFYGLAQRRPGLSNRNIYWLDASAIADDTSTQRDAAPQQGASFASRAWATSLFEEQRRYLPDAEPGGDRWFWDSLFAPGAFETIVNTPGALPAAARLRVRLWAESSSPIEPDHHLLISLNDTPVADVEWDGRGSHMVEVTLPIGLLRDGANRLRFALPGDTGAAADSILLDWAEINFQRTLELSDDALVFHGDATGYRIRLPSGRARAADLALWDITDAALPIPLHGHEIRDGMLWFSSDGAPRRFMVADRKGLLSPEQVQPVVASTLPDWPGGADLIIIAPPQFREALEPLIEARQSAGLRVAAIEVQAIYNAFSYGRPDPAAIRALIQIARDSWKPPAPRYLLLVGDASYDPADYLGGPERDIIPTQYVNTTFTGWTASDVWYGLPPDGFEEDGLTPRSDEAVPLAPVMAVGRLPAQSAEQVRDMVAKILAYERGGASATWFRRAVLPADDDDPNFMREAEEFGARLAGYATEVAPVTGDGSAARSAVLDAFSSGAGLIGYTGHGSVTLWAQEAILTVEDVPNLKNGNRLPIVFTVTCLSGFFEHPTTVSLGEALVRERDGGAVAALVPSGAALLEDQAHLSRALAHALAAPPGEIDADVRLGDAVLEAQAALPQGATGIQEVLLTFNLLGDPALMLKR